MTSNRFLTAAAFAARYGVTVKTLRVWEREGLIAPQRTGADWRVYGRAEDERATAILALRRFGLPLARIAELLKGFDGDLDRVLALQERALADTWTRLDEALRLVREARVRLARGDGLSADELVTLTQATHMTHTYWTPELDALSRTIYTPDELAAFESTLPDPAAQTRITAIWSALFAEGGQLRHADIRAPAARDWARRWIKEAEAFAPRGTALFDKAARFNQAALADPVTRPQMFGDPAVWQFAMDVLRAMREDGVEF
jgi:MerR family transcriptional regulator, thiopeptide resistance regulator